MATSWHPLDLGAASADAHLPPLLISTAFEADSYTVYLTDLTYVWFESLDRAGILDRAEEENTSIDPTDSSQLQILLSKLGLALSHGPKTTLNLHIDKASGPAPRPSITLNLAVELPGGLAPLEWPIHLAAAPQTVLTNHLMIPLLQAQHDRTQETEGLKEVLRDKDHVIQKLIDKIEALGVDLGQVFPQATVKSGRKVDRSRAEEKVRGLRPFDGDQAKDTTQIVQAVLADDVCFYSKIESPEGDNWWETVQDTTIAISKAGTTRKQTPAQPALKPKESTEDNNEFQVQSSPPHWASKSSKDSQAILDDTTDDEDLPSQPSRIPDSFQTSQYLARESQTKSEKKVGTTGGRKDTPKKPSPSPATDDTTDDEEPQSQPKPTTKVGNIGRKKEVERPKSPLPAEEETTDDEDAPAPALPRERSLTQSPTPPPPTSKPKKGILGRIGGKKKPPPPVSPSPSPSPPPAAVSQPRKGKLGLIGGKKKEATPTPTVSNPLSQEATSSQTPVQKKLGLIGGRNKTAHEEITAVTASEEETRGRPVKVEREKTPPPRETSGERAEKKRRELKRELAEKAKAPVKKKRKF